MKRRTRSLIVTNFLTLPTLKRVGGEKEDDLLPDGGSICNKFHISGVYFHLP